MRDINGITYCNDGDWVESCTALVEHENGTLEILHWSELRLDQHPERHRAAA
jgi:UDP-2,3-diacylglucosamine pyrophosphatase LpxH